MDKEHLPTGTQEISGDITSNQQHGDVKGLAQRQNRLEQLMAAIVVVLLIGFAAVFVAATSMLVDSWNGKQASYQQMEIQLQQINDKLNK
jgi:hypothetical protein